MITAPGTALLSILRKVIVRLHWMSQMGHQLNEPSKREARFPLTHSIWARVTEIRNGHEDAFPPPRLSGCCRFGQGIFAGTHGDGRDALIPAVRVNTIDGSVDLG
jgi:hypothetical protein